MADFEPPSFSLGLDFDLQSEPQPDQLLNPAERPSSTPNLCAIEEDDDDFGSPVRVSGAQVSDQPRPLKRLRRGVKVRLASDDDARWCNGDDEIEDFSSDEDFPTGDHPSRSLCSSSKSSLHGQRVLTSEYGSKSKISNKKQISSACVSANTGKNSNNFIFPKLTVSPLRRFQLIDSDSDDPSSSEHTNKEVPSAIFSSKAEKSNSSKQATLVDLSTKKVSAGKYHNEDLWKDFCSEKSSRIPTPAFNDICEEYFSSVKNKSVPEINQEAPNNEMEHAVASVPPANGYFYHKDTRIRSLVRDRLPHFFPLGPGDNEEVKQHYASGIDYMGQFGNEDNSRRTEPRRTAQKSSMRNRKNVKKSNVENISQDSENWVNPKNSSGLPRNAGNRRVHAVSKSAAGHWYTGEDGRRVYVNKNGQELTGQIAYRHYRKESGMGFKKSKKKTTVKKKKK